MKTQTGATMEDKTTHKRRVRYSGTHPKQYHEKYKELQPDKYQDTVEKVMQKGSTPAGMHRSICVDEIMEILQIQPGQIGMDATLGYGGHAKEILKRLMPDGHLHATDVDPIEIKKTEERLRNAGFDSKYLTLHHMNFSNIDLVVKEAGLLDFCMADLGVSSMQIDDPSRGFSYKTEGPLDLRLNPEKGESAAKRLASLTQKELEYLLVENSDEPYAEKISKAVMLHFKQGKKIETTSDLRNLIELSLQFLPEKTRAEDLKKTCQRSFQALRIDVNHEFEVLYEFLEKLPASLKSGGRVAILTFHSGEDRMVKKAFKQGYRSGIYSEISEDAIRPTPQECSQNPRAKSAKLRFAVKA